jgi:cold shock CspA family protein
VYRPDQVHWLGKYFLYRGLSRNVDGALHYVAADGEFVTFAAVKILATLCDGVIARFVTNNMTVRIREAKGQLKEGDCAMAGPLSYQHGELVASIAFFAKSEEKPDQHIGTVKNVAPCGTYAYARCNGYETDVFIHKNEFSRPFQGLRQGDRLTFEVERVKGRLEGRRVKYSNVS